MVMKRKIMSIMMMVAMLFSMNITAFAVDRIGAPIAHAMRSSSYLDSYSVGIEARGNGTIAVTMTVDGKGKMEKIGVIEVVPSRFMRKIVCRLRQT